MTTSIALSISIIVLMISIAIALILLSKIEQEKIQRNAAHTRRQCESFKDQVIQKKTKTTVKAPQLMMFEGNRDE